VTQTDSDLTRALVAAATAFLNELNAQPHTPVSDWRFQPGQTFDPLVDTPPVSPSVDIQGPQSDWAYLVFLGSIWMINSKGRRVRSDEINPIARRAGYMDGRAVSGYLQGNAIRRDSEGYWLANDGRKWLRDLSAKLGVVLPEVPVDDPDEDSDN
jgi:hypothetical protein